MFGSSTRSLCIGSIGSLTVYFFVCGISSS
jgi:arginine utilization protein RocB